MDNKYTRYTSKLYYVGMFLLAIVLLLSGISKLFHIQGFSAEVAQYSELYLSSVLVPFSKVLAFTMCFMEIILGIALCIPVISVFALIATLILMSFFLYLTAVNFLFPTILGSIFALAVVALASFTSYKTFTPKLSEADVLLNENVEALTNGENGQSYHICYFESKIVKGYTYYDCGDCPTKVYDEKGRGTYSKCFL